MAKSAMENREQAVNLDPKANFENEISEIFTSLRTIDTLLVSASTIITTANVTLVGFAINAESSALMIVGSILPLLLLTLLMFYAKIVSALFFAALKIERKIHGQDPLFFSAVIAIMSPKIRRILDEILCIEDGESQLSRLHLVFGRIFSFNLASILPTGLVICLSALFFGQLIGAMALWILGDWQLLPSS